MGGLLPEVNMKLTKKQLSASYVTQATAFKSLNEQADQVGSPKAT